MEYINDRLINKKILFWGIWTISPYLTLDISLFFNLLNQTKTIKRIYLDLPLDSDVALRKIFKNDDFDSDEDKVENEIKKLYPSFIEDYAKETLPYLVLLEKIKLFDIPFFLNGFPGEEVIYKVPKIFRQELMFDNEVEWENSISLEIRNLEKTQLNEMVIFFYFLKPMHYFPIEANNHPYLEKVLHADPFLGYGPQKAENSIALYSQYTSNKSYSFVLSDIKKFFFKNEVINFYPQSKLLPYPIKNDHFNQFEIYDSLLYSNFKGGGGSDYDKHPFQPSKDKIFF